MTTRNLQLEKTLRGQAPGADAMVPSDVKHVPRISSDELLGSGDSLMIEHRGQMYLLRNLPDGRLKLTEWRPLLGSP